MTTSTVAIIGAGPGGLAVARQLLAVTRKNFTITIFDDKQRVGGLWAVEQSRRDGFTVLSDMPANLSKFSVCFSDLSWESASLQTDEDVSGDASKTEKVASKTFAVPLFPRAWMVGRYLKAYSQKYIPPETFRLGTKVVKVEKKAGQERGWLVRYVQAEDAQEQKADFDFVVISTGFFGKPRDFVSTTTLGEYNAAQIPASIHFAESPLEVTSVGADQHVVVVVGGGISGVEAAAKAALELSDQQWAPGGHQRPSKTPRVYHISPRPFYALPRHLPMQGKNANDEVAPVFRPIDIAFYDLSKRRDEPIRPALGIADPETSEKMHTSFRSILGRDRTDTLGDKGGLTSLERPPRIAICDTYDEFLRAKSIELCIGRVMDIESVNQAADASPLSPLFTVTIREEGSTRKIQNVSSIVNATGFSSLPGIDLLDDNTKKVLRYDEGCQRIPILLDTFQTGNRHLKTLGFAGFYEGPYFGYIEMQARLIAERFTDSGKDLGDVQLAEAVRRQIKKDPTEVKQLWYGDYVGLMEVAAQQLGLQRIDLPRNDNPEQPVTASRYASQHEDNLEAARTNESLVTFLNDKTTGISYAAFRAMQGRWSIHRTLDSFMVGFPTGTLDGQAYFHPRKSTAAGYDCEYLYIESGILTTREGMTMQASRRYAYRYSACDNELSVWFVKDDGLTVDYIFHTLQVDQQRRGQLGGWLADADHLCVKDMYATGYEWCFNGVCLKTFGIKHVVKGPQKDYISQTWFER